MKTIRILTRRNIKMFFKDKGMFFTSMITPLILLVLYATFLGNVYQSSFESVIPQMLSVSDEIMSGLVGGQLFSSLLAVSCVTVAFCSNMLMVQDKVSGARTDFTVAPVRSSALALSYYLASAICTLIICLITVAAGYLYLCSLGWFLTLSDILLILADVFLLVMFGTALSSIINFFLHSQGQISAVGSIVSSCYGFICGAYMPIANFGEGLQKALSFLPGTYGTALLRNHATRGAFEALAEVEGMPTEIVDGLRDGIDCNIYFFDKAVEESAMLLYLVITVITLIGAYILINYLTANKKRKA